MTLAKMLNGLQHGTCLFCLFSHSLRDIQHNVIKLSVILLNVTSLFFLSLCTVLIFVAIILTLSFFQKSFQFINLQCLHPELSQIN
jgi:hypothetical protein